MGIYEQATGVIIANTASIAALAAVLIALYARKLQKRKPKVSGHDPATSLLEQ